MHAQRPVGARGIEVDLRADQLGFQLANAFLQPVQSRVELRRVGLVLPVALVDRRAAVVEREHVPADDEVEVRVGVFQRERVTDFVTHAITVAGALATCKLEIALENIDTGDLCLGVQIGKAPRDLAGATAQVENPQRSGQAIARKQWFFLRPDCLRLERQVARHRFIAHLLGLRIAFGVHGTARSRFDERTVSTRKITSTSPCAIANGGSDWVGASGCRNDTFWNACTTPTNTFRYSASVAVAA